MYKFLIKHAITIVLSLFLITGIQGCAYVTTGLCIGSAGTIITASVISIANNKDSTSIDSAQTIAKNDSLEQKKENQTEKASTGQVVFGVTMGIVTLILPLFLLATLFQGNPGLGD